MHFPIFLFLLNLDLILGWFVQAFLIHRKGGLCFISAPFQMRVLPSASAGCGSRQKLAHPAVPPPSASLWLGAHWGVPGQGSQPCSGCPSPAPGCCVAGSLSATPSIQGACPGPERMSSKTLLGLSPTCPGLVPHSRAPGPPLPLGPFLQPILHHDFISQRLL